MPSHAAPRRAVFRPTGLTPPGLHRPARLRPAGVHRSALLAAAALTGLVAAVGGLALPALADGAVTTDAVTTAPAPVSADPTPTAGTPSSSSPSPSPSAAAPAPAPAAPPAATALRITTPTSVRAGSSADTWVRLVQGEEQVSGATVLIQRRSASGWSQVAAFTTRSDGLAHGPVTVGATARFRAFFRGDARHQASSSREVVITAVAATTLGERAVAEARRHRGAPYLYGAAGPYRFDCSGFTMYVYGRMGRSLPHNSSAQAGATRRIANSAKQPGDLIFTYHGSTIGHVGIYAGGSMMWASVESGDTVRLQSFATRSYSVGRVA